MVRLLVIEDNVNDQKTAGLMLGSLFELLFADTLQLAIDLARLSRPEVILLDLHLPDSQGMQTLVSLVKALPDIPIVVWSGAGEASEAIRLGADEFIIKNGDIEVVKEAINSAIARHPFKSVREDITSLHKQITKDQETEHKESEPQ